MKTGDKITVTRKALYETHGRVPSERTSIKTIQSVSQKEGYQIVRLAEHPCRSFRLTGKILFSAFPTKLKYEMQ